jgi:cobalt/nickel transport system permease protein
LGVGHSHALYVHEHSLLHRLAPEAKILAAFGVVVAIAVTPRQAVWAFAGYAVIVAGLIALSRIGFRFVAIRLMAVAPFVVFALFIPFIATGETVEVLGMHLSVEGLWGMWNILAKAVLGASVSIVLTATTEIPEIIRGMGVLRVPVLFTSLAMFMVRYLELIADEMRRTRLAMTSRGYSPRWLSQAAPIASAAGALFVRSYERGERVHAAMLSRGFNGTMPSIAARRATPAEWVAAMILVLLAVVLAVAAAVVTS